jgi:hypothetical protein
VQLLGNCQSLPTSDTDARRFLVYLPNLLFENKLRGSRACADGVPVVTGSEIRRCLRFYYRRRALSPGVPANQVASKPQVFPEDEENLDQRQIISRATRASAWRLSSAVENRAEDRYNTEIE